MYGLWLQKWTQIMNFLQFDQYRNTTKLEKAPILQNSDEHFQCDINEKNDQWMENLQWQNIFSKNCIK